MQRYFASYINKEISLSKEDEHHLLRVMRAKLGDEIEIVLEDKLYLAEIASINPLKLSIVTPIDQKSELEGDVTLYFALAKGDKIDFVIQKATELGVKRIVLISMKRCVIQYENKDIAKKLERFNKICKEASQQSHRLVTSVVDGVYALKDINKEMLSDINLVAYEKEASNPSKLIEVEPHKSVSILIGPEGGLEENEVNYLNSIGFQNVSLGRRILRCETAALNALSVIAYLKEKEHE